LPQQTYTETKVVSVGTLPIPARDKREDQSFAGPGWKAKADLQFADWDALA
jgi:hypothetical protein